MYPLFFIFVPSQNSCLLMLILSEWPVGLAPDHSCKVLQQASEGETTCAGGAKSASNGGLECTTALHLPVHADGAPSRHHASLTAADSSRELFR